MTSPSGLSTEVLASIRIVFFQECEELLGELESGLLLMQQGERDPEIVNSVFRAVHSIKGSAGIFGFDALVRLAHLFETAMEEARSGRLALEAQSLKILLQATDALADHVRAARDGEEPKAVARAAADALTLLIGEREDNAWEDLDFTPLPVAFQDPPSMYPVERRWTLRFRPHAAFYAKASEPLPLLQELGRLGTATVTIDTSALPPLQALDPEQAYLTWIVSLSTTCSEPTIREVFEFVEGYCDLELTAEEITPSKADDHEPGCSPLTTPAPPAQDPSPSPAPRTESLRVDLDRVDRLADLAGEIVITHAMLVQRATEAGLTPETSVGMALEDLNTLTRDLRASVMAIRAQSVKSVFQRMSRLVREVEASTGKQVDLTVAGENTEVDRTVVERLTDPLTHMVRNAIDHGLERTDQRVAAGKPARGSLRISAAHRAGRIVVEVTDDGAGVDRARVKAIAVERGLIAPDTVLSDEEADNLIFLPGFSTAQTLTDLSGRGVGLDVVRRGVQAMGGRIVLTSNPGQGSTFTLSLPLTLAVLDGMVVSICGQSVVIPLGVLLESVRPQAADIHTLGAGAHLLTYRGQQVPLIDLAQALDYGPGRGDFTRGAALLVEDDTGRRAALLVDDILDQRQVVIKSLETNYRQVDGIAAATILGDGRVALILDVDAIIAAQGRQPHAVRRLAATG